MVSIQLVSLHGTALSLVSLPLQPPLLAQVNLGGGATSFLGIGLIVAGAGLYLLRNFRPNLARDYDIFFAAVCLLCGGILFFQGWRQDPILQFSQFLLTGSAVFFAVESIRLRAIATEQARRSTPIVDEDRPVSRSYGYRAELDDTTAFEDPRRSSRRIRGNAERDYDRDYGNDYGSDAGGEGARRRPEPPRRSRPALNEAEDDVPPRRNRPAIPPERDDRPSDRRPRGDLNESPRAGDSRGSEPRSGEPRSGEPRSDSRGGGDWDEPRVPRPEGGRPRPERRPERPEPGVDDWSARPDGAGPDRGGPDRGGPDDSRRRPPRPNVPGDRSQRPLLDLDEPPRRERPRPGEERPNSSEYVDFRPIQPSRADEDLDNSSNFDT